MFREGALPNYLVVKTRFSRFLIATLTGESRLITGRKPGFSERLPDIVPAY
jgi:hypothetical protein